MMIGEKRKTPEGGDKDEFFSDAPLIGDGDGDGDGDGNDSVYGVDSFKNDASLGGGCYRDSREICVKVCTYHTNVCGVHERLIRLSESFDTMLVKELCINGIRIGADNSRRYIYVNDDHPNVINKFKAQKLNLSEILGQELIQNDQKRIKTNTLVGKYVVLFIANDPYDPNDPNEPEYPDAIVQVDLDHSYRELKDQGKPFEVVFVASETFSTQKKFMAWFCKMPWLAVPFDDLITRKSLLGRFGRRWIILDPEGNVLQTDGHTIFHYYGAEAYPFTDDRIEKIKAEDVRVLEKRGSFTSRGLLGDPVRDYLICPRRDSNNNFTRVQISELEGKLMGLLFIDICSWCFTESLLDELKEFYMKLKGCHDIDKHDFQIVLVHLPLDCNCREQSEKLFDSMFGNLPWLALPLNDPRCRKLWRIFGWLDKVEYEIEGVTIEGVLAIVGGPNGSYVERKLGVLFIHRYGLDGYPFTQQRALDLEKARYEALTLDSYFSPDIVLMDKEGKEVPVFQLLGKNVLVIFAAHYCFKYCQFLRKLKGLYARNKGKNDEFEVIHIALECDESSYENCVANMPWLMYPFKKDIMMKLTEIMFDYPYSNLPGLAAFGPDGKFITKQKDLVRMSVMMKQGVFPFVKDNLSEQIIKDFKLRRINHCYYKSTCYTT